MLEEERKKARRQFQGAASRNAGRIFEEMLEKSLRWYEERGLLRATKTPEPMKPIRPCGKNGQFLACYVKPAQVDFSGTLAGGRAIRFEAKQTDTTRFTRDRLTEEQMDDLEAHQRLGAYCCVLICFGFNHFYRIPWSVWRDMKQHFKRQYITEEDVKEYRLEYNGGIIRLLADTEAETIDKGKGEETNG